MSTANETSPLRNNAAEDSRARAAVDAGVAFERLVCLSHLVLAHRQVEAWYAEPFEERAPIEVRFGQLVAPLLEGGLDASPNEKRLAGKFVEMWSTADRYNVSWRIECAVLLDWALQLRDELPPFDRQTTQLSFLEGLVVQSSRGQQSAHARLRSRDELEALRTEAELWWRRACLAQPLYRELTKPTSTLSKKKQERLRTSIGGPAELFGKPYERLNFTEMSTASSIALERSKSLGWLLGGGRWDDAKPESSAM